MLTALAAASPVVAQQTCGPHSGVAAYLAENYSESRELIGLSSDGLVMELYASEGGSWTLTATSPDGVTCLIGAGIAYQYLDEPLPPQGEEG